MPTNEKDIALCLMIMMSASAKVLAANREYKNISGSTIIAVARQKVIKKTLNLILLRFILYLLKIKPSKTYANVPMIKELMTETA